MPGRFGHSACRRGAAVARRIRAGPGPAVRRCAVTAFGSPGALSKAGPPWVAKPGAQRYLARHLQEWLPNPGLRRSHLNLALERYAHGGVSATGRRRLANLLPSALPRMRPGQLLIAATLAARFRLTGGTLAAALAQLQKPRCAEVLTSYRRRVVVLVQELASPAGDGRESSALAALQYISGHLAANVSEYGKDASDMFVALSRTTGSGVFRRLTSEQMERLLESVVQQAGCFSEEPHIVGKIDGVSPCVASRVRSLSDVGAAADVLCAASRTGRRIPVCSELARSLSEHCAEVDAARLPILAQALGRGDPHDEYVLLHGLCRRSVDVLDELDDAGLVTLLQASAKFGMHDEEFLNAVSLRLCDGGATALSAANLSEAIYSLGLLQVRDTALLDALCVALAPKTADLAELQIVKSLRGLVKLRHEHRGMLTAMLPEIERKKWTLGSLSLSNIISALSSFSAAAEAGSPSVSVDSARDGSDGAGVLGNLITEEFFGGLLSVATGAGRVNRLSSTSVQHVLTGICRMQGRIRNEALEEPLRSICTYLTTPAVSSSLTPVQAIGGLSALAKLRWRDLPAASVLLSALVGRGSDVVWKWAPSSTFYARQRSSLTCGGTGEPRSPFDQGHCLSFLKAKEIRADHCVEIMQGVHRLDLHGALPLRLLRLLWEQLLQPQLHDMRAREVIAVARALGATKLAVDGPEEELWKESLASSCLEVLKRHEHYLEGSWYTLMPFKLLCLEIDFGTFGSRRLSDILNPTLLGYVDRLRSLTREECEQNRLQREGAEEDGGEHHEAVEETAEVSARSVPSEHDAAGAGAVEAIDRVADMVTGSVEVLTTHIAHGIPIDILIRAPTARA